MQSVLALIHPKWNARQDLNGFKQFHLSVTTKDAKISSLALAAILGKENTREARRTTPHIVHRVNKKTA